MYIYVGKVHRQVHMRLNDASCSLAHNTCRLPSSSKKSGFPPLYASLYLLLLAYYQVGMYRIHHTCNHCCPYFWISTNLLLYLLICMSIAIAVTNYCFQAVPWTCFFFCCLKHLDLLTFFNFFITSSACLAWQSLAISLKATIAERVIIHSPFSLHSPFPTLYI